MADEYSLNQIFTVTVTLEDPTLHTAPLGPHGETLTDDSGETLVAYHRKDSSPAPISATGHLGQGLYSAQVTADQVGWGQVIDGRGGVYYYYVKPTSP